MMMVRGIYGASGEKVAQNSLDFAAVKPYMLLFTVSVTRQFGSSTLSNVKDVCS